MNTLNTNTNTNNTLDYIKSVASEIKYTGDTIHTIINGKPVIFKEEHTKPKYNFDLGFVMVDDDNNEDPEYKELNNILLNSTIIDVEQIDSDLGAFVFGQYKEYSYLLHVHP